MLQVSKSIHVKAINDTGSKKTFENQKERES